MLHQSQFILEMNNAQITWPESQEGLNTEQTTSQPIFHTCKIQLFLSLNQACKFIALQVDL